MGFPGSSAGKESACSARDPSSIPGSGRSPLEGIGYPLQYSGASLVAQIVKNPPVMQDIPGFNPWVGNIRWKREQLPNPVFWPSPWTEEQATVHSITKSLTQLRDYHSFMIIFIFFNIMFRSIVLTSFKLLSQFCNPRKCSTLGFIYLSPMYSWVYFTNFCLFVLLNVFYDDSLGAFSILKCACQVWKQSYDSLII